jgi:hypothetical protein
MEKLQPIEFSNLKKEKKGNSLKKMKFNVAFNSQIENKKFYKPISKNPPDYHSTVLSSTNEKVFIYRTPIKNFMLNNMIVKNSIFIICNFLMASNRLIVFPEVLALFVFLFTF